MAKVRKNCLLINNYCLAKISKIQFEVRNSWEYRVRLRPNRTRAVGGGRKGDLPTDEDKLLYILLYMKLYPTYDSLAVLTNHYRSKCGDSVQLLLPVLEMTLGRKLTLPKRHGNSLEEIFRQHPALKDIFIDGTERRVQKPKSLKKRNKLYSGKKKATTRKIVVISDERKRILYMSKTKSGRRHDKRIADKEGIAEHIPKEVRPGLIPVSKACKNSTIIRSCHLRLPRKRP